MLNESTERVAWTSDTHTGMFEAHKHRQRKPRDGDDSVEMHFYGKTEGFASRSQATELREGKNGKTN